MIRNNLFVNSIQSFLQELNLQKSWDKFEIDFTHFQENNEITHVSILDHFFWNAALNECILEAGVIHHPDNMSDHSPVYCSVDLDAISAEVAGRNETSSNDKPSWKLASQEQKQNFPLVLQRNLLEVSIPEEVKHCRNVKCDDLGHCEKSDEFMFNLMECIEKSAAETLPTPPPPKTTNPSAKKPIPGWSQLVKPFRDKAHFWHQVWISAGKPLNAQIHNVMKKTRNVYHFQFRKCKKAENAIIKNKLLDACINGNGDIFKEIKKLRKSKPNVATSMDGEKEDIPGHFKNIFEDVYNSANDQDDLKKVLIEVEAKISETSLSDVDLVTPEVVEQATKI